MSAPIIFKQSDFKVGNSDDWINPAHVHLMAQVIFDAWYAEHFSGRRLWIDKEAPVVDKEVGATIYCPLTDKPLPDGTKFSEWLEVRGE